MSNKEDAHELNELEQAQVGEIEARTAKIRADITLQRIGFYMRWFKFGWR